MTRVLCARSQPLTAPCASVLSLTTLSIASHDHSAPFGCLRAALQSERCGAPGPGASSGRAMPPGLVQVSRGAYR